MAEARRGRYGRSISSSGYSSPFVEDQKALLQAEISELLEELYYDGLR
jgi:hypothetical protein